MPDKKHILICHAREDDRGTDSTQPGWVTAFARNLQKRLGRDDLSIETALPQSAVSMNKHALLAVFSPFFMDALENDPEYADLRKMLLQREIPVYGIEKTAVEENRKPAKLRDIPLFRFWPDNNGDKADQEYYKSLDDLYREITGDFPRSELPEILPEKAKKVFICYAEADIAIARQMYDNLKKSGLTPWMEDRDLLPGQNRRTSIWQSIQSSAYFIVLLSNNSVVKGDFNRQQKIAFEILDEMPQSDVFVIPVRIHDCEPGAIHSGFVNIQTADLFPSYEEGLQKILKTLGVENSPAQALEKPDIRKSVYLAEVSSDLFREREEVRRYLEQDGYKVVPETPLYHPDANQYAESVRNALNPCIGFVQLLSLLTCRMHPAQPCYAKIQQECAAESGIPLLLWRKPGIDLKDADADHRKLLEGPSVLAVHMEEFKREVKNALSRTREVRPVSGNETKQVFVYLNADKKDEPLALQIGSLMDSIRIGYALPPEDEPDERFEDFKEHLCISDGVIVVYGEAVVNWARRLLVECRKAVSRNPDSLVVIAVYEGPPESKTPLNYKLPGMFVMECRDCMNTELFRPFFQAMCQRRAL
ncbi:MAG: toll/interleukin-1 receptor domain-containing protein [Desulfococcaceae bacterium]